MKATLVRALDGWTGDARLYKVDPPMPVDHWDDGDADPQGETTEYVIVSATFVLGEPETYIFPAEKDADQPSSWSEQPGSYKGALDHAGALSRAGYAVDG